MHNSTEYSGKDALKWMKDQANSGNDQILFRGQDRVWPTIKPSIARDVVDDDTRKCLWSICHAFNERAHGIPDCGGTAARRSAGTYGPQAECLRAWTTLAFLAISMFASPAAAQDDCVYPEDWDDIQWFRRCIDEHGLPDDWKPWMLHEAAFRTDNPAIVQLLVGAGADPHEVDDGGRTPLHRGAGNDNPVVTAHLLAAGADPNALDNEGYTPLHYAAAGNRNARVIARILDAGADPVAESNEGRTPLHSALRYTTVPSVISTLVQSGAAEGLAPLQLAALQRDDAAVTSLLAEGADPNTVDGYGWNSLHVAVLLAGPGVVAALLEAGADPNASTVDGLTALHLAARQASAGVVADLLGAGADPNAAAGETPASDEEDGGTSLHLAARWSDDPSVVLVLLDGSADAAARDNSGRRPVDFARGNDAMLRSAAYPRLLVTRPTTLAAGRAVTGSLQASDGVGWGVGYYDEWTYSAAAGQRVVITMDSEDLDAYLVVLREDGTEVASDDDGGGDFNARVEFEAPATGQYTILAASLFSDTTGRYTIRVERPTGSEETCTTDDLSEGSHSVR